MAANVSVPNNFVTATPIVADDVDANFTALVDWINANAVHLDGAKAFTATPSGPAADPTTANQLVRKAYMDAVSTPVKVGLRRAAAQSINSGAVTDISWDTEDFDASGFIAVTAATLTVPSAGTYAIGCRMTMAVPHTATVEIVDGTGIVLATKSVTSLYADGIVSCNTYLAAASTLKVTWSQSTGTAKNVTGRLVLVRLSA